MALVDDNTLASFPQVIYLLGFDLDPLSHPLVSISSLICHRLCEKGNAKPEFEM
jgi:hypothetical protein